MVASMMVMALGLFFIIVGITVGAVVYRESREWKKMILPLFDRFSSEAGPGPSEKGAGLTPQKAAIGREIVNRLLNHADVAGLLGGAATVVMGVLIVLIGLTLNS